MNNEFTTTYCYFVEYIENGVLCSDSWSQKTLDTELKNKEVEIVSVTHISELEK